MIKEGVTVPLRDQAPGSAPGPTTGPASSATPGPASGAVPGQAGGPGRGGKGLRPAEEAAVSSLCAGSALDGRTILVSGGEQIRRWDPEAGILVGRPLARDGGRITALITMPGDADSTALVSGATDGTVRIWDLEDGSPVRTFEVPGGAGVRALAAFEDVRGRPLLVAAAGSAVHVWDPLAERPVALLDGHCGPVTALSPVWAGPTETGRTMLATASDHGTILTWNTSTWQIAGELPGHTGAVRALCTQPGGVTGPLLASAGDDGTIHLGRPMAADSGPVLTGHNGPVTALCGLTLPAGGQIIASGGADGTVRRWDPETGRPLGPPLGGSGDAITALCESPDSKGVSLLAGADRTGRIRFWDPSTGAELTEAAIRAA